MLKDLLKEAVVLAAGRNAEGIAELLDSKKHVNEFLITKKLEITINQTRNLLYKLSDYGLVSSTRKKDKKKGWYTYFWKLENLKALEFLKSHLEKRLDQLNRQIESRESKMFYVCERCHIEVNEENALLYDFTCNECGDIFTVKDNTKLLKELKKNQEKIQAEIDEVQKEVDNEKGKIEKEKEKELKKQKAEADRKKAEKKAERDKAKKAAKKIAEKTSKKATKKAAKKTVKKVTKKAAKKSSKKQAKKSSSKKTTKKAAKKSARKTTKKSSK